MARSRLLRSAAAFKLAAAPVLFGGARSASSFQVPISGSCYFTSSVVKWYFSDDGADANWTSPLRDEARIGINGWTTFPTRGFGGSELAGIGNLDASRGGRA